MNLSNELISMFVKATNDNKPQPTETTVHATTVMYDGRTYVKIDGSDLLTPVAKTTSVSEGDRVTVVISNHTATITGNLSDPSASSTTVEKQGSKISEFEIIMAYKVTTKDLEAVNAAIENLRVTAARIENADIVKAQIETLEAKFATLDKVTVSDIEAITAEIETLEAEFGKFENLSAEDADIISANISDLKGYTADFTYVTAEVLEAIEASINILETEKLSAKDAVIKYAQIDFSNIGEAAIQKLFTDSGIIKDLVMSDGAVTGELVGVTIKGDRIEANTLVADKLIVKNSKDGLYYKLNIEAGAEVAEGITEEDLQNGLHGTAIIAKSITAEKIHVDDLVAFGATIAGFNIVGRAGDIPGAIYSGVKSSVDNTTRGIYMDDDGQMNVGDASNFVKFYKETTEDGEEVYKLRISADTFVFGGSGMDVESELANTSQSTANNQIAINNGNMKIEDLKSLLQQVITDDNGQSLMMVTEETFVLTEEDVTGIVVNGEDGYICNVMEGVTTTTGDEVYHGTFSDGTEMYCAQVDSIYYKVTHNPETCTFNIGDLQNTINSTNSNVSNLSNRMDGMDGTVTQMLKTVTDLALIGGYIVIDEDMEVQNDDGTTDTVPAIILGESDSDFKVIITNKQIAFCEGNTIPAYISGQTLIAQKIEVKVELAQTAPDNSGQFIWKVRANGNYGLTWKEASN